MRRVCHCVVPLLAVGCLACVVAPESASSGQEPYTKEMIAKAWQERQDRTQTATFSWTEKQTDYKGAISQIWRIEDPSLTDIIPPKHTTLTNECSLAIDGQKMKFSYTSAGWSRKTKRYEPTSYAAVFDGDSCRVLHEYGPNHEKYWPQAIIRAERTHVDARLDRLQPLLMTWRALMAGMRGFDLDGFRLVGATTVIDKRTCLELQQRLPVGPEAENRLWVDPARGFVVVRYLATRKGIVKTKLDVRYGPDKQAGWVPKEWQIIFNDPRGELRKSFAAALNNHALNGPIPSTEFQLEFPPGTRVSDAKNDADYIVRRDGSGRRMIPPEDIGATYEQMLRTAPGEALPNRAGGGIAIRWPAIIGSLLAAACFLFAIWRLKRGRLTQGDKHAN